MIYLIDNGYTIKSALNVQVNQVKCPGAYNKCQCLCCKLKLKVIREPAWLATSGACSQMVMLMAMTIREPASQMLMTIREPASQIVMVTVMLMTIEMLMAILMVMLTIMTMKMLMARLMVMTMETLMRILMVMVIKEPASLMVMLIREPSY